MAGVNLIEARDGWIPVRQMYSHEDQASGESKGVLCSQKKETDVGQISKEKKFHPQKLKGIRTAGWVKDIEDKNIMEILCNYKAQTSKNRSWNRMPMKTKGWR